MSYRTMNFTNIAVATAIILASALAANVANAKPGGIGGGGFKAGSAFKPSVKPISFPKGPIKTLPSKPFPIGPIKPGAGCKVPGACGGPGPKPGSGGGHGHGKYWVLGGVTILAASYEGCGYEYYKWKSTGSSYWRTQYEECRGW